jgi:hypothetical protein
MLLPARKCWHLVLAAAVQIVRTEFPTLRTCSHRLTCQPISVCRGMRDWLHCVDYDWANVQNALEARSLKPLGRLPLGREASRGANSVDCGERLEYGVRYQVYEGPDL